MAELRSDSRIIVPHVVVMQSGFGIVILAVKADTLWVTLIRVSKPYRKPKWKHHKHLDCR